MTAAATAGAIQRRRNELVWRAGRAPDIAGVFDAASTRLRQLVPFDAAAWVTTDPATGLPNGPTRLEGVDDVTAAQCSDHWRREFLGDDVNLFRDVAIAAAPAASLRRTTGDPRRSRRFRTFLDPLGFGDELRAVLRVGATPWGTITLMRRHGQPAFTERETELVASLSDPLGEALRTRAQDDDAVPPVALLDQPGLLVFSSVGDLVAANEHARVWLAELDGDRALATDLGVDVPLWMIVTVFQAAAVAGRGGDGTARCRVRHRGGRWVVCHATSLLRADGSSGDIAVVVEPARPAEIAPIIIDAYDLTDRERQIARLIARGSTTTDIADELYLSPHTVRGHVKALFRKVAVSSRGELVAKLFAEHYQSAHREAIIRA